MPSPVHVRERHRCTEGAGGEGLFSLERAVAVTQQHADRAAADVGDGQVGLAVAVHVPTATEMGSCPWRRSVEPGTCRCRSPAARSPCCCSTLATTRSGRRRRSHPPASRTGIDARGEGLLRPGTCRCRCPAARSPCCCRIGDDQIGAAVAVHVRHRHRRRIAARGEVLLRPGTCRCRCPAARSACCCCSWRRPDRACRRRSGPPPPPRSGSAPVAKVCWRLEGAVAVAQQHADRVVVGVGDDQVGYPIAVQVPQRRGVGPAPTAKVAWLWKDGAAFCVVSTLPARSWMLPLSTRFSPTVPLPAMPLTDTV